MTRILIADDQPSIRSALRLLIEQQPDLNVTGEIDNNDGLLDWLYANKADILLLDWESRGISSYQIIPQLNSAFPVLKIIVLDSKPEVRQEAIKAGAAEFVGKNEPPERLLEVIARLAMGVKGEK
jgi:DNA-binding NarL/FixJ family response regulator